MAKTGSFGSVAAMPTQAFANSWFLNPVTPSSGKPSIARVMTPFAPPNHKISTSKTGHVSNEDSQTSSECFDGFTPASSIPPTSNFSKLQQIYNQVSSTIKSNDHSWAYHTVATAYSSLRISLVDNALSDKFIFQNFHAETSINPTSYEELLEHLAIVGQHRKSQSILAFVKETIYTNASEYLCIQPHVSDYEVMINFTAIYGSPVSTDNEQARKALQILAEHRDSADLIGFALGQTSGLRMPLLPTVSKTTNDYEALNERLASSDNTNRQSLPVRTGPLRKTSSSPSHDKVKCKFHANSMRDEDIDSKFHKETIETGLNALKDVFTHKDDKNEPKHGTVVNSVPTPWSNEIVDVVVGQEPSCREFSVHRHITGRLMRHASTADVHQPLDTLKPLRLEYVDANVFEKLLTLLYLPSDWLKGPTWEYWTDTYMLIYNGNFEMLAELYILSAKYGLTEIMDFLLPNIDKTFCITDFLSASLRIYKADVGDASFRLKFKHKLTEFMLRNLNSCDQEDNLCSAGGLSCEHFAKHILSTSYSVPAMAQDVIEALMQVRTQPTKSEYEQEQLEQEELCSKRGGQEPVRLDVVENEMAMNEMNPQSGHGLQCWDSPCLHEKHHESNHTTWVCGQASEASEVNTEEYSGTCWGGGFAQSASVNPAPPSTNHFTTCGIQVVAITDCGQTTLGSLALRKGDKITNVTGTNRPPIIDGVHLTPIMFGCCNGIWGTFPANFVTVPPENVTNIKATEPPAQQGNHFGCLISGKCTGTEGWSHCEWV